MDKLWLVGCVDFEPRVALSQTGLVRAGVEIVGVFMQGKVLARK